MPFEVLETVSKANMPPTAKVTYLRGKKAKANAQPKLVISIPTTICETAKAKSFVLLVGSGTDSRAIRIRGVDNPESSAGVKPTELKHAFVFRFGYVPKLGDEAFDGEGRPVTKISDNEYEISVPEHWFNP